MRIASQSGGFHPDVRPGQTNASRLFNDLLPQHPASLGGIIKPLEYIPPEEAAGLTFTHHAHEFSFTSRYYVPACETAPDFCMVLILASSALFWLTFRPIALM